jgi:hypothetical protein
LHSGHVTGAQFKAYATMALSFVSRMPIKLFGSFFTWVTTLFEMKELKSNNNFVHACGSWQCHRLITLVGKRFAGNSFTNVN